MLDGNDRETILALRLLRDCVESHTKPLVFWIGAGASTWCNYPLWEGLANKLHSDFNKYEKSYDLKQAIQFLGQKDYPSLFTLCQTTAPHQYYSILAHIFRAKDPTPVYNRFINALSGIRPLFILTTNIDECLENNLRSVNTIEKSDFERCIDLIQKSESFVCKLHGSVRSIKSTTLTEREYDDLLRDEHYLDLIRQIFVQSIVVFFGYSLGDQYVIDSLVSSSEQKPIFGDGPHFIITSTIQNNLPDNIHIIRYEALPHSDHRSAIQVIEIIKNASKSTEISVVDKSDEARRTQDLVSGYYISDIYPPGTWTTSQNLAVDSVDGRKRNLIIGQGFVSDEILDSRSTAMHDLLVGLLCFDSVYLPLTCLTRAHDIWGSALFWRIVEEGAIRFIHWKDEPAIIFPSEATPKDGDLAVLSGMASDSIIGGVVSEIIRKQIKPYPGKEATLEEQLKILETKVMTFPESRGNDTINLVKGTLLNPSIRKRLGISDAIIPTSIPRWLVFPVLRLAHIVRVGKISQFFHIAATKLPFGGEEIAGIAFAAAAARDWTEDVARYVLSGRFDTDLGEIVMKDPEILEAIIKFRDSEAGIQLRNEILGELSVNAASDFVTSINAGLRRTISPAVLQNAHDQLAGLLIAESSHLRVTPAVWNNLARGDETTRLWRKRGSVVLKKYCRENKLGLNDLCPCGSGEKLKYCCAKALDQ